MPTLVELSELEAQRIAERVLRQDLGQIGLQSVEVRSGEDHDGDPGLFVTAVIQEGRDILPSDAVSRAHAALHDALLARGEKRFPYLRFRWIGDESVDDTQEVA